MEVAEQVRRQGFGSYLAQERLLRNVQDLH